jgi:hypothetical protein
MHSIPMMTRLVPSICRFRGGYMQTFNTYNRLPETGLVRLSQILGDKKKGIPPIIPVSKSTWWEGVKSGRFPKPIKLGERTTCWNVLDIRLLINKAEV